MTVDTLAVEATQAAADTPDVPTSPATLLPSTPGREAAPDGRNAAGTEPEGKPRKTPAKRASGKRKTLELTLTVTGTADGEWHAELKQGSSYLARNLAVAAAAVSRAAKELHADLAGPIDEVIEAARAQQAAKVAALEAELEAARRALAELD
ncbi:MAG TPA: DUF6319 family protein [Microlunatus sp.]|nr:DUF6319 family protein [Microlunatus sp.]